MEYRTVRNWEKKGTLDKRKGATRRVANKLTQEEADILIKTACKKCFYDLTPYEIVPILAEEGIYIASVSTFYRVLRAAGLVKHRGKSKKP